MPDDASPETFALENKAEATAAPSGVASASRPRRNRLPLIAAGALVVLATGVWGFNWWTTGRFVQSTNDAYLDADQVVAAPKVQGYVSEVLVGDNQQVRAGQPLVRIDPRAYQHL